MTTFWLQLPGQHHNWEIVHDGSYLHPKAAYAWRIYSSENCILEGQGMAPGNPSSAFRAEIFGLMAWYCGLYHIMTYYGISPNVQIQSYSDNNKLIHYHHHIIHGTFPDEAYIDEYDILKLLQHYHGQLKQKKMNIAKVQKIQLPKKDQEISNKRLVDKFAQVDQIARQYRHSHTLLSHEQIWYDRIHIQDVDGDITGNEKYVISNHRATYHTEHYYSLRWKITMEQLAQYNWNIYTKNYEKSSSAQKKFIIKLMTGWLPVHHQVNKMMDKPIPCQFCQQDETIEHMFRCAAREEWRNTFLRMSKEKLNSLHTPPQLYDRIMLHLIELLDPASSSNHFRHFTIFAGLLPSLWQPDTFNTTSAHRAPHQWTMTVSKWLTQQGYNLWQLRNSQVHDNQDEQVSDTLLNQKIEKLYGLQGELSHFDKALFQQPIENEYKLTNKQKQEWIEQTTQTVYKCIEEHQKNMKQGQSDIRKYFHKSREDR